MTKIQRNPKAVSLANQIIEKYQPKSVEDMQNALKDIFGPMFENMLKGELNHHLGYESNSKEAKETSNRRNGYGKKKLLTSAGEVEISTPRDRDGSFEPKLIPKRSRDVSAIEDKVIAMYTRGMSQRDISATIEEIYGFPVSHDMISEITDTVMPELEEWQSRPLSNCYAICVIFYSGHKNSIFLAKKEKTLYHNCMLTRANTIRERSSHGKHYIKNL